MDRHLAGPRTEDEALDADDVAKIPVLERIVRFRTGDIIDDVDLHAPGLAIGAARAVLQRGEARLAHDALEHHPPGDRGAERVTLERLLAQRAVRALKAGAFDYLTKPIELAALIAAVWYR